VLTLGEIGPIDGRIVPALILSFRDENPKIRGAAASALFKIGPAAEAAVPALIAALDDKLLRLEVLLPQVRGAAIQALSKIERRAENGRGF